MERSIGSRLNGGRRCRPDGACPLILQHSPHASERPYTFSLPLAPHQRTLIAACRNKQLFSGVETLNLQNLRVESWTCCTKNECCCDPLMMCEEECSVIVHARESKERILRHCVDVVLENGYAGRQEMQALQRVCTLTPPQARWSLESHDQG